MAVQDPAPAMPIPPHGRPLARPRIALSLVSAVYFVATLVVAFRLRSFLWDEVVYASQLARGVQPVEWSAPRAWGMPLLLAPVDVFTTSTLVIRVYLSALAGIGSFLAFRPWLRIIEPWVVPVAAGLLATLWVTVFYGAMAYPNLWLGLAVVAGTGYVVRALRGDADRWALIGTIVTLVIASMLRPSDASVLALPLLVVALAHRSWRLLGAILLGLGVGWTVWTVEAFLRFGGFFERLDASAKVTDIHLGFYPARLLQAADGPRLMCRPAVLCADIHGLEVAWLLVLPLLVAIGLIVVRPRLPFVLAAASAACLVLSYVLTVDWENPRYLMPAWMLLTLPVGAALVAAVRWRHWMAVVIAIALGFHIGAQARTYQRILRGPARDTATVVDRANALHDRWGVRTPCILFGPGAIQLSFLTGCRADPVTPPALDDPSVRDAIASGQEVVVLLGDAPTAPPQVDGWQVLRLPGPHPSYAYASLTVPSRAQPPPPTGPVGRS